MYMGRMVSLSERAYSLLRKSKREGMSFSDVVIRLSETNEGQKTENIDDLISWAKERGAKFKGKTRNISQNIDRVLYGAKK